MPTEISLRNAVEADFARIIGLNDAEVRQTSPMDLGRLRLLDELSCHHKVAIVGGQVAAFLIAIRDGIAFENDNYNWFCARLPSFLYVDRIVVGAEFSGLGIGSALYRDLFAYARLEGIRQVVCEYNLEPPNPASRAFHDRFGFKQLGTQRVADRAKLVSLQAAQA